MARGPLSIRNPIEVVVDIIVYIKNQPSMATDSLSDIDARYQEAKGLGGSE